MLRRNSKWAERYERQESQWMAWCWLLWPDILASIIKATHASTAMQVNILEAKNRLSQLIKSAQAGEEIVIANRGRPVVRLVPTDAESDTAAKAGSARSILEWLERNPLPAYARRSAEEIDAAIREERDAWD